jgi:hypothetical protein
MVSFKYLPTEQMKNFSSHLVTGTLVHHEKKETAIKHTLELNEDYSLNRTIMLRDGKGPMMSYELDGPQKTIPARVYTPGTYEGEDTRQLILTYLGKEFYESPTMKQVNDFLSEGHQAHQALCDMVLRSPVCTLNTPKGGNPIEVTHDLVHDSYTINGTHGSGYGLTHSDALVSLAAELWSSPALDITSGRPLYGEVVLYNDFLYCPDAPFLNQADPSVIEKILRA